MAYVQIKRGIVYLASAFQSFPPIVGGMAWRTTHPMVAGKQNENVCTCNFLLFLMQSDGKATFTKLSSSFYNPHKAPAVCFIYFLGISQSNWQRRLRITSPPFVNLISKHIFLNCSVPGPQRVHTPLITSLSFSRYPIATLMFKTLWDSGCRRFNLKWPHCSLRLFLHLQLVVWCEGNGALRSCVLVCSYPKQGFWNSI